MYSDDMIQKWIRYAQQQTSGLGALENIAYAGVAICFLLWNIMFYLRHQQTGSWDLRDGDG